MSDKGYNTVESALRERINGLVDEALARADTPLSLSEIEDIALKVRAQMGAAVTHAVVAKQAPVAVPGPVCEQCGQKKRPVVSRSGEGEGERPYYDCEQCRRGLFPPR